MKLNRSIGWGSAGLFSFSLFLLPTALTFQDTTQPPVNTLAAQSAYAIDELNAAAVNAVFGEDEIKPIPAYIERSLDWLASAQFENGGWGAGSHADQSNRDPRNVSIDPATTAFSAMALVRAGNTLSEGAYRTNLGKALEYLLKLVEDAPEEGPSITDIRGTQPQAKLGQNIDVSMVSQFLTRMLPETKSDRDLHARVEAALDKCIRKIQIAQNDDGSFSQGGWAGVLQSAMANSALERASAAGARVDKDALEKSRSYQQSNVSADGSIRTEAAAGVKLYSIASSQRAAAPVVADARQRLKEAKRDGRVDDLAEIDEETLRRIGYSEDEAREVNSANESYNTATELLEDDTVLAGFGNNGGEEFLSYMMTSEALAQTGGQEWENWYSKMNKRLEKIQNPSGSWSGHHCITSPVFSTAAVILTMTADRDAYTYGSKK
ncbi:MAG: terpene cyclase/mutase family protein [Rhodothermales bacterium]|nr:terpene cyclase/mutase family protein [Rhodothermales bacterium]